MSSNRGRNSRVSAVASSAPRALSRSAGIAARPASVMDGVNNHASQSGLVRSNRYHSRPDGDHDDSDNDDDNDDGDSESENEERDDQDDFDQENNEEVGEDHRSNDDGMDVDGDAASDATHGGHAGGDAAMGEGLQPGDLDPDGEEELSDMGYYNLLTQSAGPERLRSLGYKIGAVVPASELTMLLGPGRPGPKLLGKFQRAKLLPSSAGGDTLPVYAALLDFFKRGVFLQQLIRDRMAHGFTAVEAGAYLVKVSDFQAAWRTLRSAPRKARERFDSSLPRGTGFLSTQLEAYLYPDLAHCFVLSLIELCTQVDHDLAKVVLAECAKKTQEWTISVKSLAAQKEKAPHTDPDIFFASILSQLQLLVSGLIGAADLRTLPETNTATVKAFFSLLGKEVQTAFIRFLRTDERATEEGHHVLLVAVGNNDPTSRDFDNAAHLDKYVEAFLCFLEHRGWQTVSTGGTGGGKAQPLAAIQESQSFLHATSEISKILAIQSPKLASRRFNQLRKQMAHDKAGGKEDTASGKGKFSCDFYKVCFDLKHDKPCTHTAGPGVRPIISKKAAVAPSKRGKVTRLQEHGKALDREAMKRTFNILKRAKKPMADQLLASFGYYPTGAAPARPGDMDDNAEAAGIPRGAQLRADGAMSVAQSINALIASTKLGKRKKQRRE